MDGNTDVIASPNEVYFILDYEAKAPLYLFDTISHTFKRKTDNFLGSEMLDFGTNSAPCFLDINGDNLKDLIVANSYQISKNDARSTQFYLFLNIGSEQNPIFNLIDSNFLNLKTTADQYFELVPFAGDINGDGDMDLIVGSGEGYLIFIENLSNNPKLFTPANLQFKYQQIYAGRSSAPCMFDYNKDGKMDLIVGEKNGNVNYFENIGTRENPQFDPNPATSPNSELWANINTRAPLYGSGFGQVNIFKYNNEPIIITANEAGKIQGYTLKDNIHTPVNLDHLGLPFVGEKLRLSAADINGDGILELALGNNRGGVSLFTSPFRFENPLSSKQISEPLCDIKLFPNPVTDILNIRATMNLMDARYSIFDINGKTLATGTIPDQNSSINLNPDWSQGIYFITFTSPKGSFAAKFVK
ncbi:MAG: T9SS type A sorting domain-containing protein [Saprospiraceae bacterium]|nr:T9SS type A sorting domain-containing protein [Saprospiraceae bacterium]